MIGGGLRARITLAAIVAAVLPVALFGLLLVVNGSTGVLPLVLTALVVAALVGLAVGGLLVGSVTGPLRALGARLDRITAGERPDPLPPLADDELGRLAERQEELPPTSPAATARSSGRSPRSPPGRRATARPASSRTPPATRARGWG